MGKSQVELAHYKGNLGARGGPSKDPQSSEAFQLDCGTHFGKMCTKCSKGNAILCAADADYQREKYDINTGTENPNFYSGNENCSTISLAVLGSLVLKKVRGDEGFGSTETGGILGPAHHSLLTYSDCSDKK